MQSRDDRDFEIWAKCQLGIKQQGHTRAWVWKDDWSFSVGTTGVSVGFRKVKKDRCSQCGVICDRLSDKYTQGGADKRRNAKTRIWKAKIGK
jgi:hypothetical protein